MSIESLLLFAEGLTDRLDQANAIAATSARALTLERIFVNGEDCTGSKIGEYSTKETLIGRSSFLTQAGANKFLGSPTKRKNLEWVTINGKRLAKLPGGYKNIRDADGRQTAFVDLSYSGNMRSDWQSIQTLNGFDIGWLTILSSKKAAGNEKRFAPEKIFCLSDEEIEKITEIHVNAIFGRNN